MIKNIANDIINLFFPNTCQGCADELLGNENTICTKCLYELPLTNFIYSNENPVAQKFWGRVFIHYAASYYYFHKGSRLQSLMHNLKYKKKTEIGQILGTIAGNELKNTRFEEIDIIAAIPLHISKLRKRGYNQSDYIAEGIAKGMNKPFIKDSIKRLVNTSTQTKKSRFERWENVSDVFAIDNPEIFKNKHILLVDDVLTTGATMESCGQAISKIEGTKVSIFTLAYADVN